MENISSAGSEDGDVEALETDIEKHEAAAEGDECQITEFDADQMSSGRISAIGIRRDGGISSVS